MLNETPYVLEGSGLTPVDGMGIEIRGMRTRGGIQTHETLMKVRPLNRKIPYVKTLLVFSLFQTTNIKISSLHMFL